MNRITANPVLESKLLYLTAVAAFLEIALLARSLHAQDGIATTCFVLCAFQCGYFFSEQAAIMKPIALRIVGAICMAGLGYVMGFSWDPLLAGGLVMPASAAVQGLRSQLKLQTKVSVAKKTLAKGLGMVFGGIGAGPEILTGTSLSALAVVVIFIRFYAKAPQKNQALPSVTNATTILAWAELFHHMHYFSYVYVFWGKLETIMLNALGALFLIGWVGYFVAESLLRERTRMFSLLSMSLGHLVCAIAIGGMAATTSLTAIMLLWFITGIGGGSAYMLANGPQHPHRERFENAGHVLGTASAGVLAAATGTTSAPIWLAAGLAVLCAVLFVVARVFFIRETAQRSSLCA